MKKITILMLLAFFTLFASCKKETVEFDTTSTQSLAKDELNFASSMDDATYDIEHITTSTAKTLPCNVTMQVDTINDSIVHTLLFNGDNCSNTYLRQGIVNIKRHALTPWIAAGTVISMKFNNFKFTKLSNNAWHIFNGTIFMKNVDGRFIQYLGGNYNHITHEIFGSLEVVFDNSTSQIWNFNKQKIFTGCIDSLILTTNGIGNANGYSDLSVWGINRDGEQFYTQILQPIKRRQLCNWLPSMGIKKYQLPYLNKSATMTYGFDINNQPLTNLNDCPYSYKVDWVNNSQSGNFFVIL